MDLNLLKILFLLMTSIIIVMGSLINWLEDYLPAFFPQTFRYGKFAYDGKPSKLQVIEVPKRWFKHFYLFSSIYSLYALYLVIDVYMYGAKPSFFLTGILDLLGGDNRSTQTSPTSVMIALSLMTLQSFRRFYETWFISVFSNGKINLSQYMIGFIHYWGAITVILSEASGFQTYTRSSWSFGSITVLHMVGVAGFCYAWFNQYRTAVILANLRKNPQGKVVTSEHRLPHGGLFSHLSSPHLTCEVLIYLSLLLILASNTTFLYVFLWVFSNQLETALLNHWWYQKTFPQYPKQRKAFIPFVI